MANRHILRISVLVWVATGSFFVLSGHNAIANEQKSDLPLFGVNSPETSLDDNDNFLERSSFENHLLTHDKYASTVEFSQFFATDSTFLILRSSAFQTVNQADLIVEPSSIDAAVEPEDISLLSEQETNYIVERIRFEALSTVAQKEPLSSPPTSSISLVKESEDQPPKQVIQDDEDHPTEQTLPTNENDPEKNTDSEAALQAQKSVALGRLLSMLNHSPYVFGTPFSVTSSFAHNTQLAGDWGGNRNALINNKIFFDVYSMTVPQGVVSGATDGPNPSVIQSLDAYVNVVELWSGAILHGAFQSKIGDSLGSAGTLSPVNYATSFPVGDAGDFGLLTEYYLFQTISPKFQLILGKLNVTNFADSNVFANNYRYQFQNAALNNNLMLGSYFPPSTWAAVISLQPTSWFNFITAVGDPNGSAENFADNFLDDVLVAQEFNFSYEINQKPGNFRIGWLWASIQETNFEEPFRITENGLIDFRDPLQTEDGPFMFFLNFDQYLFTVNPTSNGEVSERQFITPRGLGIFGRFGIDPEKTNFISAFGSLGLGAKGIIPERPDDQFGFGWFYVDVADGFEDEINASIALGQLTGSKLEDETGFELYYNFAITPAFQLAIDAQYIINPFSNDDSDNVFILGGRVQINF